jgi:hypothetical protein
VVKEVPPEEEEDDEDEDSDDGDSEGSESEVSYPSASKSKSISKVSGVNYTHVVSNSKAKRQSSKKKRGTR